MFISVSIGPCYKHGICMLLPPSPAQWDCFKIKYQAVIFASGVIVTKAWARQEGEIEHLFQSLFTNLLGGEVMGAFWVRHLIDPEVVDMTSLHR